MSIYEEVLAGKDEWVSLKDVFDKKNELKPGFKLFFEAFSSDILSISFYLIQYGVVLRGGQFHVPYLAIPTIQQYLNNANDLSYPIVANEPILETKRKDFIHSIRIQHLKNWKDKVYFSDIKNIDPKILQRFEIRCDINSPSSNPLSNVDLVQYWQQNKFKDTDVIRIRNLIKSNLLLFLELESKNQAK